MNLYLFPATPGMNGGYNYGVKYAYEKLRPKAEDVCVWCDANINTIPKGHQSYFIKLANFYSWNAFKRILGGKFSQELSVSDLSILNSYEFDNIFCDEVIFYHAIREKYPTKKITLRFHNVFARILLRQKILGVRVDWRFWGKMKILSKLEHEIFTDTNVYKIFITDEDAEYYKIITGKNDYEVWHYEPSQEKMLSTRPSKIQIERKLVWFGGVEGHKTSSIRWVIQSVLPKIREKYPETEFHLYGSHTEVFDDSDNLVFGHGFYEGNDIPFKNRALFVNPDILGGGIKVKLLTFFNQSQPFISSPFGYEGYSYDLEDGIFCMVANNEDWANTIERYFEKFSNTTKK